MSSSLLLKQCPACLVRLIWIFVRWEISVRTAVVLLVLLRGFVKNPKNPCVVVI